MKQASIIGAGIVGLAMARALAIRGYKVTVFERGEKAVGASIRNFGMIWPIGQPKGALLERAMLSRSIWKEICTEAKIWHSETGSLHVVNHEDEMQVIEEFYGINYNDRRCSVLSAAQTLKESPAVNPTNLKGSLWSESEMIVDPREAIATLPNYLNQKYGVAFHFNTAISHISYPNVYSGKQAWQADEIYVCSGADFETLYPEIFAAAPLTKTKLQMMRTSVYDKEWNIGPSLCGGLTLIHYAAFSQLTSLAALRTRYEADYADYLKWGIHVLVSQNGLGEVTLGDSHEYGLTFDPFDKAFINDKVLAYLNTFAQFPHLNIAQTWHGIYPKLKNGGTEYLHQPESGITIINGLGGAGMTLSFGLCEEWCRNTK